MIYRDIGKGRAYNADCFDVMALMPDGCVDMLFADLPYGTTACKWDSVIPFERLWPEFNRICKLNAAMVFTASQPFTSVLVASNIKNFRSDWIWKKEQGTGFPLAKKRQLSNHESILIFSNSPHPYFPQMTTGKPYSRKSKGKFSVKAGISDCYTSNPQGSNNDNEGLRYPVSVLEFSRSKDRGLHPTQKPVALLEYLIQTYTQPGDLVFDPTAGSLTTGVAAENLGRRWVCCEKDTEHGYFEKGIGRF